MKKIVVEMADTDAIEVRENSRLAPRYGMNQLSFHKLMEKEQKVSRLCQEILKTKEFPIQLKTLIEYGIVEAEDFFIVLEKAKNLLEQGFHVLIIRGMMDCACGRKSGLGYGCFDEKFSPTFTDVEVRKDFWGTENLFSIEMVSALLFDVMNGVPDQLGAENIKKSELVRLCISHYLAK
ncbi:MAG: hypothetical protein IJ545_00850 [Alphaproteobacteria bacterium]|nr:hypothetical protein [Alphaproteobacteria bacterium]